MSKENLNICSPQDVADRLAVAQQRLPLGTILLMIDPSSSERERQIDQELSRMLQEGNGEQA